MVLNILQLPSIKFSVASGVSHSVVTVAKVDQNSNESYLMYFVSNLYMISFKNGFMLTKFNKC